VVIQLQSTFLLPNHCILLPNFSNTSTANSEFLNQVLVFVSPTWSFSRIESQFLFHNIRKHQQLLQRAAYKVLDYKALPPGTLSKFPLSTGIQFCDGPVLDKNYALIRYWAKICVHSVLWERVCIHTVLGKNMCSSSTGKNSTLIRYWEKICVHPVLGKNLRSSDTGQKSAFICYCRRGSVLIWY
jgi:hypothetical protein